MRSAERRRAPRSANAGPPAQGRFVVHERRATRLHDDFRLELSGVLRSWAISKGPSMDPGDRRLAVMTPDHPLEYIEGIIPPGHHGAGPVGGWDHGTCQVPEGPSPIAQLRAGALSFVLKGRRLKGGFALARLRRSQRGQDWLLIKKRDAHCGPGLAPRVDSHARTAPPAAGRTPPCDTH